MDSLHSTPSDYCFDAREGALVARGLLRGTPRRLRVHRRRKAHSLLPLLGAVKTVSPAASGVLVAGAVAQGRAHVEGRLGRRRIGARKKETTTAGVSFPRMALYLREMMTTIVLSARLQRFCAERARQTGVLLGGGGEAPPPRPLGLLDE